MDKKASSLINLCAKAGKLASGESACEKALRSGEGKLVIISKDASENTRKKFVNKAFYYKVPVLNCCTREDLSLAVGKENRVTLIITDEGFANSIKNMLGDMDVE